MGEKPTMEKISMQQLKEQRFSQAAKFVNDTIKDVESGSLSDGCMYWFKDGITFFGQDFKNRVLSIRSRLIFDLKDGYNLSYVEIEQLLSKVMYKYTDNGNLKINLVIL
jgi:hypothetical protein